MIPESDVIHPPWYRQPWMWLVVGLPLTSVVASLTMVAISVKYRDDLVRDDWYKAGRAINQDLRAEKRAAEMNISGTLSLDALARSVRIEIAGGEQLPDQLQLQLVHSTLSQEDMTAILTRAGATTWTATLPRLPMGKRLLMLEPILPADDAGRWRLRASNVIFQGEPVALLPAG